MGPVAAELEEGLLHSAIKAVCLRLTVKLKWETICGRSELNHLARSRPGRRLIVSPPVDPFSDTPERPRDQSVFTDILKPSAVRGANAAALHG